MSISNPTSQQLQSPVSLYLSFKAKKGVFVFYDKENKKEVEIPKMPPFVVLDRMFGIVGFNKPEGASIISNQVHNVSNEPMRVAKRVRIGDSFKKTPIANGLYADIKHVVKENHGSFAVFLYIMMNTKEGAKIARVEMKGSLRGAFFDGLQKIDTLNKMVSIASFKEEEGANGMYYIPKFKGIEMPSDLKGKAIELDHDLQAYFKGMKGAAEDFAAKEELQKEDSPYPEGFKAKVETATAPENSQFEDDDDGFIPEDDLPF